MANAGHHRARMTDPNDFESALNELFQRAAANPDPEHQPSSSQEPTLDDTLQRFANQYNLERAGGSSSNQGRYVADGRDLE